MFLLTSSILEASSRSFSSGSLLYRLSYKHLKEMKWKLFSSYYNMKNEINSNPRQKLYYKIYLINIWNKLENIQSLRWKIKLNSKLDQTYNSFIAGNHDKELNSILYIIIMEKTKKKLPNKMVHSFILIRNKKL